MDIRQSNTLQRTSARDEKDEKHICPLQLDLIERCIDLWTAPNDIVLDPFCGIGSVPYQAVLMGRRGLGIELKDTYFDQAAKNMQTAEESAQNKADADQVRCRCPHCGIKVPSTICPICGAEI
jgi:DNA modification methylase